VTDIKDDAQTQRGVFGRKVLDLLFNLVLPDLEIPGSQIRDQIILGIRYGGVAPENQDFKRIAKRGSAETLAGTGSQHVHRTLCLKNRCERPPRRLHLMLALPGSRFGGAVFSLPLVRGRRERSEARGSLSPAFEAKPRNRVPRGQFRGRTITRSLLFVLMEKGETGGETEAEMQHLRYF
jgi:hypothetical protein